MDLHRPIWKPQAFSTSAETGLDHRSDTFRQGTGEGTFAQYSEESWFEMTREYLVVYEKGPLNWSAFSPDVPGCGSLGDALEDTRANMREAMDLYMADTANAGEPIPEATAASVNFDEFDPEHKTKQYFVEWLAVQIPLSMTPNNEMQAA